MAEDSLAEMGFITSRRHERIYAALGQTEEAFRWLETAYEPHANWMVFLTVDPVFDDLRSDPRFRDLMRRMNFPA